MDRGWRLGGRWYAALQELPVPEGSLGCAWWVVRLEGEGARHLLQLWEPLPAPKVLDTIRGDFLRSFSLGEPMDLGRCHMGFDDKLAWYLQELEGIPFLRLWGEEDLAGRESLVSTVRETMGRSRVPRLLAPEAIGIMRGRILVPRVLGTAPWGHDGLVSLPEEAEGPGGDPLPPARAVDPVGDLGHSFRDVAGDRADEPRIGGNGPNSVLRGRHDRFHMGIERAPIVRVFSRECRHMY